MRIGLLLAHLCELDAELAAELRSAAERHRDDHDVYHQCLTFSITAQKRVQKLEPFTARFGGEATWSSAVGEGSNDLARRSPEPVSAHAGELDHMGHGVPSRKGGPRPGASDARHRMPIRD